MEKVLVIANQFPPAGGSGIQRTSKFIKYLSEFNYEPIVITINESNIRLKDESLKKDIPESTKIYRSTNYNLENSLIGKIIGRKILIPDSERLWELSIHKKTLEIIRKENIKIIYTTSAPYSSHLLGLYIKRKLGSTIKWVADFRDEWCNNPYTLDNPHNKIRISIEKKMEKMVLENSDYLIANTPVMRLNFIEQQNLNEEIQDNFYVIPNGYDRDDLPDVKIKKENKKKFTITYTGLLYGRRKPNCFYESVKELIDEGKIPKDKLDIKFIGNYKKDIMNREIKKYGLDGVVELYDYMAHKDAVQMLGKSDVLLLLEGAGIGDNAFYTGKIFEYMMIEKVVLGILPNGCAMDMFKSTNIGEVALYGDIEDIKNKILKLYTKWKTSELNFDGNASEIKKYSRYELTKKLAYIFDKCKEGEK